MWKDTFGGIWCHNIIDERRVSCLLFKLVCRVKKTKLSCFFAPESWIRKHLSFSISHIIESGRFNEKIINTSRVYFRVRKRWMDKHKQKPYQFPINVKYIKRRDNHIFEMILKCFIDGLNFIVFHFYAYYLSYLVCECVWI